MLLPEDSYNIATMTTTQKFVTRIDPMGGQSPTVPHPTLNSNSVVIIGWAIIENHPVPIATMVLSCFPISVIF
jgi:hypothetical protein